MLGTRLLTVILTVSRDVQVPLVIVHTKSYTPAVSPVTVDVGDVGVVMVAALVVLHKPEPTVGVLELSVVVLVDSHSC